MTILHHPPATMVGSSTIRRQRDDRLHSLMKVTILLHVCSTSTECISHKLHIHLTRIPQTFFVFTCWRKCGQSVCLIVSVCLCVREIVRQTYALAVRKTRANRLMFVYGKLSTIPALYRHFPMEIYASNIINTSELKHVIKYPVSRYNTFVNCIREHLYIMDVWI